MTILGIPPSSNPNKRCPYLGLQDDSETALGFASNWNCCHHVRPVAIPSLEHQRSVCLTTEYTQCPVFLAANKKKLPKDLRMSQQRGGYKLAGAWLLVLIVLFFFVSSALILSGHWKPTWIEDQTLPEWISKAMQVGVATNTNTPLIETDTPVIVSNTPVTPTKIFTVATQTEPPVATYCAYPLETLIGAEKIFILHRVTGGENMAILAERYETTEQAIDAVNFFLPSPIWAELVIVIPVETTDVDEFPSFRPIFLEEDDISIEELAQSLTVSSSDLIEFNYLDSSCLSFHGWVLVPEEKIP